MQTIFKYPHNMCFGFLLGKGGLFILYSWYIQIISKINSFNAFS